MPLDTLVILPIAALFAGVAIQFAISRVASATAKGWVAFSCALVALGSVLGLIPTTLAGRAVDVSLLRWDGPLALAYHVDGLAVLFALMATGIGAAVLLYSIGYMAHDLAATRFYSLMLVFVAGFVNLVYTADLFLLYLSWEVIGLCSFLLVGFWYRDRDSARGARKVLTMTHVAGYGLLAAVVLIFARTGSTLWTDPKVAAAFGTGLFLLILVAAIAKSVQFPLHTWIPDAMAAPTPVSALLHAACYVKAGVYLIARLHSLGPWPFEWRSLVTWLGAATLLIGVLYALAQHDLKRLLAFHTVSQIGYMLLGIGLATPLGIAAGLLHCLNHGLFKGGLFLCAGAVQHATGTRDMDRLGGLIRGMPKTTAIWLVVAGGIAGVPLLNGFVSKWLIYTAALDAGQSVPALIAWVGSILTVFSFLKATSGTFLGGFGPATGEAHDPPRTMLFGAGALALGCVVFGVAPQVALALVVNPAVAALGLTPATGVSWLGITTGSGAWYATGGFALALVAMLVGVGFYAIARPARRPTPALAYAGTVVLPPSSTSGVGLSTSGPSGPAAARSRRDEGTSFQFSHGDAGSRGVDPISPVFTGGEPLAPGARLLASDFSAMVREALAPLYRATDVDRFYLAVWHWLLAFADRLGAISLRVEERAISALLAAALGLAGLIVVVAPGVATPAGSAEPATSWPLVGATALALVALLTQPIPDTAPSPRERGVGRVRLLLALAGLLALGGLAVGDPTIRLALLEAASFAALYAVWRTAPRASAAAYLAAVLLALVGVVGGTILLPAAPAVALALLVVGFAVKVGLVPAWLWLPKVAARAPASVVGVVIAVVDVAAFAEVLALRASHPGLFAAGTPWLALGVVSALGGGLLMLAQRDLKRLLAFSTVEDLGVLLVGVSIGGLGLAGAAIGLSVHALGKGLLFCSLSTVEAGDRAPATLESGGLATRYPLAGVGFLLGALAVLGVPPTVGYLGHWRLYSAAAATPLLLVVLVAANVLALLAYARAVTVGWWGPVDAAAESRASSSPHPPRGSGVAEGRAGFALLALMIVILAAGLVPGVPTGGQ